MVVVCESDVHVCVCVFVAFVLASWLAGWSYCLFGVRFLVSCWFLVCSAFVWRSFFGVLLVSCWFLVCSAFVFWFLVVGFLLLVSGWFLVGFWLVSCWFLVGFLCAFVFGFLCAFVFGCSFLCSAGALLVCLFVSFSARLCVCLVGWLLLF